jgi:hypothetical protein
VIEGYVDGARENRDTWNRMHKMQNAT